jgi:hypothetical protein
MIGADFTALEQAVLSAICEMHPGDRAALETQLASATVRRRDNTGAGFYTKIGVEHASDAAIRGQRLRNGPEAKIVGLDYGMGFILWFKDGFADSLEGFSNGAESTKAIDLETVPFEINQS